MSKLEKEILRKDRGRRSVSTAAGAPPCDPPVTDMQDVEDDPGVRLKTLRKDQEETLQINRVHLPLNGKCIKSWFRNATNWRIQ